MTSAYSSQPCSAIGSSSAARSQVRRPPAGSPAGGAAGLADQRVLQKCSASPAYTAQVSTCSRMYAIISVYHRVPRCRGASLPGTAIECSTT